MLSDFFWSILNGELTKIQIPFMVIQIIENSNRQIEMNVFRIERCEQHFGHTAKVRYIAIQQSLRQLLKPEAGFLYTIHIVCYVSIFPKPLKKNKQLNEYQLFKNKKQSSIPQISTKNHYITVDVLIIYWFFYCLCDLQMIKLLKD